MSEAITREDIFEADFGEEKLYEEAPLDHEITLPLTKLGFEALLKRVSAEYKLPQDDASRSVLAGYIHHIPNETHTTTVKKLGVVLHKAVANSTSWRIDQEIKEKRRKELEEKASTEAYLSKLSAEAESAEAASSKEKPAAPGVSLAH